MTREEEIKLVAEYAVTDKKYKEFKEGIIWGAKWADEHPNTEDIETILAYTFKGLGWLAENVEFDMGTMGERALACTETLQMICNQAIMELRKHKNIKLLFGYI